MISKLKVQDAQSLQVAHGLSPFPPSSKPQEGNIHNTQHLQSFAYIPGIILDVLQA